VIGERAVDIVEVAAIAIAAGMRVDDLAQIPLAYPTYGGILARAAVIAAGQLGLSVGWQADRLEGALGVKRPSGHGEARQPETASG
jgi:dihydrolipoamide dehydrogenase